jgi:hypothetical protein
MSQNMYSLQGGYLLWRNNKYIFWVRVELVDLVDQTLVYALSPILSSAHTAPPSLAIFFAMWCKHFFLVDRASCVHHHRRSRASDVCFYCCDVIDWLDFWILALEYSRRKYVYSEGVLCAPSSCNKTKRDNRWWWCGWNPTYATATSQNVIMKWPQWSMYTWNHDLS